MRETKVNTTNIKQTVFDLLKRRYGYSDNDLYKPKKEWSDGLKQDYRNEYSNQYNALRRERKQKKNDFWITMAGKGNIELILKQFGLKLNYQNKIVFKNMAREVLKSYLETIVIPKLEEVFNLTGIKVGKDTSPMCAGVLNLEDAEIKKDDSRE